MLPIHRARDRLDLSRENESGYRAGASLRARAEEEGDPLDAARGMVLGCVLGGLCWLLLAALLYGLVV